MRLINVDALKEWIENWFVKAVFYHPYNKSNNISIPELYDILERMPTVEAIPIKWIEKWVITTNMGAGRTIDRLLEDWEKENATEVND